mgnify:CR=1 FL=1
MAGFFGNPVARYVTQGNVYCPVGSWAALRVGAVNQVNRQWIKFQVRSNASLAIRYVNRNADGTFTAPTASAHDAVIIPSRSIMGEPISEDVVVYGRAVNKAGTTAGGVRVTVTEYS